MAYPVIFTLGRLKHPFEHPNSQEFLATAAKVYEQAHRTGHLVKVFDRNQAIFPHEIFPGDGFPANTLTIWTDIESLYRFSYHPGLHADSIKRKHDWLAAGAKTSYIIWWAESEEEVSWQEAVNRLYHYLDNGPTPHAFDFKNAFDADGNAMKVHVPRA